MSNKKIIDFVSGSISDSTQGYLGDINTGALTRTSFKAMKDYFITGVGGITTANDGLSLTGSTVSLGGTTINDKVIDLGTNANYFWFKTRTPTTGTRSVIIGSINTAPPIGNSAGLLIQKKSTDDNNRQTYLNMTIGDVSQNGMMFLNYSDVTGQCLPLLQSVSNAPSGSSAAFNLDLAGRDSHLDFSHFSVFYYDYNSFTASNNQASGMRNSNFVNFTNGTGADPTNQRHFLWVDKSYNWMIGNNGSLDRPIGALTIGSNTGSYAIYQKVSGSTNWFAGNISIGTVPTVAIRQLEIVGSALFKATGSKSTSASFISYQDSTGFEIGSINFNATDTFIGLNAGGANQNSIAVGGNNTAIGNNALPVLTTGVNNTAIGQTALTLNLSGSQNTAIGVGALFSNTNGINNTAIGHAALANNTIANFNVVIGQGAALHVTTGTQNTIIGAGAAQASFNNTNCIIIGGQAGNTSGVIGDATIMIGTNTFTNNSVVGSGNIILGGFSNGGSNNTIGPNNILIGNSQFYSTIANSIIINTGGGVSAGVYSTSNVVLLGDNTQNTILGTTAAVSIVDSGDRLQVSGSVLSQQYKLSALNTAPTSVSASGTTGEIRFVSGSTSAMYVCVSTNHWLRSTLTTF